MGQEPDVARVAAAMNTPGLKYRSFGNLPVRSESLRGAAVAADPETVLRELRSSAAAARAAAAAEGPMALQRGEERVDAVPVVLMPIMAVPEIEDALGAYSPPPAPRIRSPAPSAPSAEAAPYVPLPTAPAPRLGIPAPVAGDSLPRRVTPPVVSPPSTNFVPPPSVQARVPPPVMTAPAAVMPPAPVPGRVPPPVMTAPAGMTPPAPVRGQLPPPVMTAPAAVMQPAPVPGKVPPPPVMAAPAAAMAPPQPPAKAPPPVMAAPAAVIAPPPVLARPTLPVMAAPTAVIAPPPAPANAPPPVMAPFPMPAAAPPPVQAQRPAVMAAPATPTRVPVSVVAPPSAPMARATSEIHVAPAARVQSPEPVASAPDPLASLSAFISAAPAQQAEAETPIGGIDWASLAGVPLSQPLTPPNPGGAAPAQPASGPVAYGLRSSPHAASAPAADDFALFASIGQVREAPPSPPPPAGSTLTRLRHVIAQSGESILPHPVSTPLVRGGNSESFAFGTAASGVMPAAAVTVSLGEVMRLIAASGPPSASPVDTFRAALRSSSPF